MAADRDFAIIDKIINAHDRIYTPDEYIALIKKARTKGNKFIVNKMEQSDFLDFGQLKVLTT